MSAVVWVAVLSALYLIIEFASAVKKSNQQGRERGWWL